MTKLSKLKSSFLSFLISLGVLLTCARYVSGYSTSL